MAEPNELHDWRGIPITPGAPVLYYIPGHGAVEAFVTRTNHEEVMVQVWRRQYGGGVVGAPREIPVFPKNLTVLGLLLPPSSKPTEVEMVARERERLAEARRIESTHSILNPGGPGKHHARICSKCGIRNNGLVQLTCEEVQQNGWATGDVA